MATANPPADPQASSAALGLLASLYNAGQTGKHYVGMNLGQDAWLDGPGFGGEWQAYYLSTGKYPSVLGLYDQELAQNIYPPSPAGEYFFDTWGNQIAQWSQILAQIEWVAGYDGIVQALFQGSDPIGQGFAASGASVATYVQSSTGLIVTASGGSTVATVANPFLISPATVAGTGPYTVTMVAGNNTTAIVPTACSTTGTVVTITAPGTWISGQQVYLAGFTNNAGSGWPSLTGTWTITTGGSGSFTITTSLASGTGTATGAGVYTWGLVAGQPIVNGQTIAWTGSSGTWTVSAVSVTPTNAAQATSFTLTQTSGSGGAAPSTSLPMTVTAQSVIQVSTSANGFNGLATSGVPVSNWGWGVLVLGTTAATRTLVRFTYTGWFTSGTNYYVTGVLVYQVPWFSGTNTISAGQQVCAAQALGRGGDSSDTVATPLQWSTTAYSLLGSGTSTTYQLSNKANANNNLNAQLDQFASLANTLAALNLPIIFRPYAESQGGQYWFSANGGWFSQLWKYTVAYLTGGTGPAESPGGFRGTAQAIKTTTSITTSGNQATVTTNATHTLVAGDCVYFSGITGTASPLNGAILPITPGSTITATTFVVTLTPALVAALPTGSYTTGAGNVYQNQPVIGCNGLFNYGGTTAAPYVPTNMLALPISGQSGTGSAVTFTTTVAHGMLVGQTVQIAGYTTGAVNGYQTITAVTSNTFTIASSVTTFAGSGTYQAQLVPVHNALYSYVVLSSASGLTNFTMPLPAEMDLHASDAYGNTAGLPNAVTGGLYQLQQNSGTTAAGSTAPTSISTVGLVTMPAAHGLVVGDWVSFSGITGGTGFTALNGALLQVLTVPSSTTFTVTLTGASGTPTSYGTLLPYVNLPVGMCEWSNLLNNTATQSSSTLGYDTGWTTAQTLASIQASGNILIPTAQASWWGIWNGTTVYNGIMSTSDGYHLFTHKGAFNFSGTWYLVNVSITGAFPTGATLTPQSSILPAIDLSTLQSGAGNLVSRIFGVYDESNGQITNKTITGGTAVGANSTGPYTLIVNTSSGISVGMNCQVNNGIGSLGGTWQVTATSGTTITIAPVSWNSGSASGITTSSGFTFGGFSATGGITVPTTNGVMMVNYSAVQQTGLFSYVTNSVTFTLTSTAFASPPALLNAGTSDGTVPAGSYLLPIGHIMQYVSTLSNGTSTFLGTTIVGSTGSTTGGPNYVAFVMAWGDNYSPLYQNPAAMKTFFNSSSSIPLSSPDGGAGSVTLTPATAESAGSLGAGSLTLTPASIDSGGESPRGSVTLTPTTVDSGGESPVGSVALAGTAQDAPNASGAGSVTLQGLLANTFPDSGAGSVTVTPASSDSAGASPSGSVALAGASSSSPGVDLTPSGSVTLSGLLAGGQIDSGSGNVALTGTGTESGTIFDSGAGVVSIAGSAATSPNTTGTGGLTLSGTAAGSATDAGSGSITITPAGAGSALVAAAGSVMVSGNGIGLSGTMSLGLGRVTLTGAAGVKALIVEPVKVFPATHRNATFASSARSSSFVAVRRPVTFTSNPV